MELRRWTALATDGEERTIAEIGFQNIFVRAPRFLYDDVVLQFNFSLHCVYCRPPLCVDIFLSYPAYRESLREKRSARKFAEKENGGKCRAGSLSSNGQRSRATSGKSRFGARRAEKTDRDGQRRG